MRTPWTLCGLVVLVLAGVGASAPAAAQDGVAARIDAVQRLLVEEQIDEAVVEAAALYASLPDVAPVQVLAGTLKFYQGDYRGAVTLLERGLGAYGDERAGGSSILELARGALEVTADYRVFESEHFLFRTPRGRDELLGLYALEALERSYRRLGAVFGHHPRRKIVVDIMPSPRALARMSPLSEQAITTSGTVALAKYGRLMVSSPKALLHGYSWLDTLAHEYIHLLITERTRNSVPVWLHEGLAKYYETRWRGEPGLAMDPGSERLLAGAVKRDELITFAQMHPSMALLPTQRDTALAFAEVFTVVEYLRAQHGDAAVAGILAQIREGASEELAIARVTGGSFQDFVAGWRRHLEQRPYKIVPGAEPRTLTYKRDGQRDDLERDDVEVKLDPKVERWRRLGGILRQAGRPKAAAIEYQRAVDRAGLKAPRLFNLLASTYIEAGDHEQARVTLEAALAALPEDAQTQLLSGRVALAQRRLDDAREAFELANRQHPFHPEIHASLLSIAIEQQDAERTARERAAMRALYADAARRDRSQLLEGDSAQAARLSIETHPFARVLIDGEDLGLWTPLVELPLKAGAHEIRLQNRALGVDLELQVELQPGQHEKIERTFSGGGGHQP